MSPSGVHCLLLLSSWALHDLADKAHLAFKIFAEYGTIRSKCYKIIINGISILLFQTIFNRKFIQFCYYLYIFCGTISQKEHIFCFTSYFSIFLSSLHQEFYLSQSYIPYYKKPAQKFSNLQTDLLLSAFLF